MIGELLQDELSAPEFWPPSHSLTFSIQRSFEQQEIQVFLGRNNGHLKQDFQNKFLTKLWKNFVEGGDWLIDWLIINVN